MALDFPASPSNGQTFTDGSTTWTWDGTKWSITSGGGSGGGGKILQVVNGISTSVTTTTSTTYGDTGLSASITMTSPSNTVLVFMTHNTRVEAPVLQASNYVTSSAFQVLRGSKVIQSGTPSDSTGVYGMRMVTNSQTVMLMESAWAVNLRDTPGSGGTHTYKSQFRVGISGNSASVNYGGGPSSIILMEVAA